MTQTEFAAEIGVSFTTVNRWENGRSMPNLKALKAIDLFCKERGIAFNAQTIVNASTPDKSTKEMDGGTSDAD